MTYRDEPQSNTPPDPWRSPITGQAFFPAGRWNKPGVELIDWQTNCRKCGWHYIFTLRADYPDPLAARLSVRWHSLCRSCRTGGAK